MSTGTLAAPPTGEALAQQFSNVATMMQTGLQIQHALVERAMDDDDFRARLVDDPKGVFEQEFGVAIPDSVNFQIHESDFQTIHLALPMDYKLSEEQLEAIAAGLSCCL